MMIECKACGVKKEIAAYKKKRKKEKRQPTMTTNDNNNNEKELLFLEAMRTLVESIQDPQCETSLTLTIRLLIEHFKRFDVDDISETACHEATQTLKTLLHQLQRMQLQSSNQPNRK